MVRSMQESEIFLKIPWKQSIHEHNQIVFHSNIKLCYNESLSPSYQNPAHEEHMMLTIEEPKIVWVDEQLMK